MKKATQLKYFPAFITKEIFKKGRKVKQLNNNSAQSIFAK
jgi:hypothetical protein